MRKTIEIIEKISQWSGEIFSWTCLALALLLTWEVFMRYVLSSPTKFTYEFGEMMGVAICAGGLAYTHLHGGHVRVDIFWKKLSPKGRALADIINAIIFFFPLSFAATYVCARWTVFAISIHEIMTTTYLYPPAWPVRSILALGFLLFIPQGIAKLLRDILIVRGIEIKEVKEI